MPVALNQKAVQINISNAQLKQRQPHKRNRLACKFRALAAQTDGTTSTENSAPPSQHVPKPKTDASTPSSHPTKDPRFTQFDAAAQQGHNLIPVYDRIFSDQLTPVLAYRCLVKEDDREAPSFLFESVQGGEQAARFSQLGSQPALEVLSYGKRVVTLDHVAGSRKEEVADDPVQLVVEYSRNWKPAVDPSLPQCLTGGWVGFAGYDTVRYDYGGKLPFSSAPPDDRQLPDLHLALYYNTIVFDAATKLVYVVAWVPTDSYATIEEAFSAGVQQVNRFTRQLDPHNSPDLPPGRVAMQLNASPTPLRNSDLTKEGYLAGVEKTKEYIQAGDVFQLVLSHRFERRTFADPFEIYRALRIVNPSPYMVYLQARGCILIASSPEILCRVDGNRVVTNRPLAGTRARGRTPEHDKQLEKELLADEKECSEHIMLVDLGRNDVGRVAKAGSVSVDKLMEVERYSHVMHISSTVTGELEPGLDCWDALRAALPAGTISGAPKVRAMQIIDELEAHKRGPYGGGMGYVSFHGAMDMALALRTLVVQTQSQDTIYSYATARPRRDWVVHIQAGAGLVADSVAESEYQETVNKAAALGRAVDLAEQAFVEVERVGGE